MKKFLLLMALIVISFTGFSKESKAIKNSIKYKKVKIIKKFKLNKKMDCYPIQINASCGTFLETMCSEGGSSASERQEAYAAFSDMYDNAVCN
ncbi:hypothetical protein [Pedobacter gandavensis]|uniref:Uncharacterized protein n=1 Tax=Pedobacter gandavensis TaxID=2679963 RepID=A0ABR6EWW8_9SPHI|nr:hypothetical protein [Pedobacter gandavensis]MBB2148918.1 hypothetical protein [Pedobacter gandavensis]